MPMNTTCDTRCGRGVLRAHDLLDDLARVEVALEAGLPGRAERATHRAAGLRRDAHGRAFRAEHQHGLDLRAVVRAPQPLARRAVGARLLVTGVERERERVGEVGRGAPSGACVRSSSGVRCVHRARRRAARRGTAARPTPSRSAASSRRATRRSGWSCAPRSTRVVRAVGAVHGEAERAVQRERARVVGRDEEHARRPRRVRAPRAARRRASARPSPVPCARGSTPIT